MSFNEPGTRDSERAPATSMASTKGRDNNFNLIRIVAALLVVLTHAFGLSANEQYEPAKRLFGLSFGSWAVDVFFALSGFLICKSWLRQPSVRPFLMARARRIYPALWVCVALCVFGLGLAFTTLPWSSYLVHPETLKFVAENATLLPMGTSTSLPGVFAGKAIDSPLWTLPYELKMYLLLLAIGWSGLLARKWVPRVLVGLALAGFAWGALHGRHEDTLPEYCRFVFSFFAGVLLFMERDKIALRTSVAVALSLLLIASVFLLPIEWRLLLLTAVTPYLAVYLALVPEGRLRAYNRLGDYSYGVYIYGAPVQMVLLATIGSTLGVLGNFVCTATITLVLAALSWHLLESRVLRWNRA